MGSGSSRSGRALRRRRSPDCRPAPPSETASEDGTRPRGPATPDKAPGPVALEADLAPAPAAPPDGREETLRLLDQLLAESAAWGPQEPAPRGPARPRPRPAAGAGSAVSPEQWAEDHPEGSCASEAPGSTRKRPEGQTAISYDYSEEELMASIEREYCR
ncbi:cystin-1 [Castor canadensis]|uniref:Cystin-1 n=1 Tax=Castor canadensis TaxID=51338 RepID=A0A8B7VRS5_CASCN|nr:cystin-1 [Castor canadensis]XP_020034308.1 cystin-1 [Castor canadensis]